MNRRIIFRGKQVDNGKWIIGHLWQDDDDHFPMIHQNGTLDKWEQVMENTVGEFTGVTDVKGIDIFEGDIVRIHCNMGYDKLGVVKFKDGCFGVYNESEWRKFHPLNLTSDETNDMGARIELEYTFEVLGNIFDDSQILANQ